MLDRARLGLGFAALIAAVAASSIFFFFFRDNFSTHYPIKVISAAIGVGFAVDSQAAERAQANATRDDEGRITSPTQRQAFELDRQAAASAGAATAFFVTGGALVAAGATLLIFDRVRVAPAPGGAVLTVPLDATFAIAGGSR